MKLFDNFNAVKFEEENLILVTIGNYLYYIYNLEYKHWKKWENAGNDCITIANYPDVSVDELKEAMNGVFPSKETDFMRLCSIRQLRIRDMLDLLEEDYPRYMTDRSIWNAVQKFLIESTITHKSYFRIRSLFDGISNDSFNSNQVIEGIKRISKEIIGIDIFKEEIGIVDGHNPSSYFWIMPVRVLDYSDTNNEDNVAEMSSNEISIEETDFDSYLFSFVGKYFDDSLPANMKRVFDIWDDEDGNEHIEVYKDFEWYLTPNFYTYESVRKILSDIKDAISTLQSGETKLAKENNVKAEVIIDFYERFIYRMEYMMKVGEKKGFDLISFMGP